MTTASAASVPVYTTKFWYDLIDCCPIIAPPAVNPAKKSRPMTNASVAYRLPKSFVGDTAPQHAGVKLSAEELKNP
ncbi:hypothetical protein OGAPHI_007207 [Ogataea philodendri]|uniref:Uncharacterized protein n=1 Tax=Ogataea philodendri TaxID=1378263 RepID=A0A9P8NUQ7_9ASCO|nr:uncharacterized protein OGAPHI_007207 [Ogataea philodendri]KAH3660002.1 hypothetical protein OGAPHI_007207 [Ogataea philodendri]